MNENRPSIKSDIKRKVRQKCGFACVICGCIICDIDHIDEWSTVKEHELDNLTLLCTLHHRQKSNGILSKDVVKERTLNIIHKPNNGAPDLNFSDCRLVLGNNLIIRSPEIFFTVLNKDFLKIGYDNEIGQVIINAAFYDRNGAEVFKVEDNIYTTTDDLWDVEMIGNKIIFREGPYKRLLEITLDGVNNFIVIKGKIYFAPDKFILVDDNGLSCNGHLLLSECRLLSCFIGLAIASYEDIDKMPPFAFGGSGTYIGGIAAGAGIGYCAAVEDLEFFYSSPSA